MNPPNYFSDLQAKFRLLVQYKRNPDINDRQQIAPLLQGKNGPLRPNNLQQWYFDNIIPAKHVLPICKLFSITAEILRLDLRSFENEISKVPCSDVLKDIIALSDKPPLLTPHLIQGIDELEFEDFLELMEKEFPDPDIRDPDQDLEMWLREAKISEEREPSCIDKFLVAKDATYGMVVALLYASHFPTLGFLFISYLAIDHELVEDLRGGSQGLLAHAIQKTATRVLLQEIAGLKWTKGVLTEIAHDGKEKKLKRLFLGYARRIFGRNIYEIDIEYVQPALDARGLQSVRQDLLYMPGLEYQNLIDKHNSCLPKDEAIDILRFVYDEVYAANFDTTSDKERYRTLVEEVFYRVSEKLPSFVPLIPIQAVN